MKDLIQSCIIESIACDLIGVRPTESLILPPMGSSFRKSFSYISMKNQNNRFQISMEPKFRGRLMQTVCTNRE